MGEYKKTCQHCYGDGTFNKGGPVPVEIDPCPYCDGEGYIVEGQMDLSSLTDAISDLGDKVDDVIDKCNNIKEVVDEL